MPTIQSQIQAMVDRETEAWNRLDADALVDLFHPDMVWPWPPEGGAHDPEGWIFPQGRYDRKRWRNGWARIFRDYELVHNKRRTVRIAISKEKDGAFAVVDVDTLWRKRTGRGGMHWKGRACKIYTKVGRRWLLIAHTGLLDYVSAPKPRRRRGA